MNLKQTTVRGNCQICNEPILSDEDLFVHFYIEHPEVSDNISKMLRGEAYETASELRKRGVLK